MCGKAHMTGKNITSSKSSKDWLRPPTTTIFCRRTEAGGHESGPVGMLVVGALSLRPVTNTQKKGLVVGQGSQAFPQTAAGHADTARPLNDLFALIH